MAEVDDKAAAWAVRLEARDLDDAERRAFEAWCAAHPRHRGALLRAQAGLRLMDQARVVKDVLPAAGKPRARPRRAFALAGGLAAAALAAVVVLLTSPGELRTQVGEQRRVALQDGSVALINTDSRLAVSFDDSRRRISLKRGEAWFKVAKDTGRPFVVDAGQVHVRATGTAFSVRRDPDGVRVVVTEGRVLAWSDGSANKPVPVVAGQQALIAEGAPAPPKVFASKGDDVLAWRRGEIILSGQTIAAAAAEFNRYNQQKIVLGRDAPTQATMVGYFLIDDPKAFAVAVAHITGGHVREGDGEIVVEYSQ